MRKSMLTFFAVVFAVITSYAQLEEGHVAYKMEFASDNPDMAMGIAMFQGSTMDLYFKDNLSRVDINMGVFMNMTTVSDEKSDKMLMLMGGMMGNKAIRTTLSEIEAESAEDTPEYDVNYVSDTKKVLGYLCKHAILTDEEGNELDMWYTEEIAVKNLKGQQYFRNGGQINGFPLEFSTTQSEMTVTFTATTVEKKVDDAKKVFDMSIPEDYEEMSYEDLKSMGM